MLIFARVRGREKADLWMSSRPGADRPWGQPAKLGPSVNSKNMENGPSLSADGLTLVFHSDRPGGQGSFDLWMSTRAGTTGPWGEPVNLGPSVNSRAGDAGSYLSADGQMLYFSSRRPGGHGGDDIWQAPLLPPGARTPLRPVGSKPGI
jgi:Tol biopolymer transport system component